MPEGSIHSGFSLFFVRYRCVTSIDDGYAYVRYLGMLAANRCDQACLQTNFRYTAAKDTKEGGMGSFAVIDTETNWEDEVMSIGCCIADADTFGVISAKYHVLIPECEIGGMYYDALFPDTPVRPMLCSRYEAISDLLAWFFRYDVRHVSPHRSTPHP